MSYRKKIYHCNKEETKFLLEAPGWNPNEKRLVSTCLISLISDMKKKHVVCVSIKGHLKYYIGINTY